MLFRSEARLTIIFQGTLNEKLRGFYRSFSKLPSGETVPLAATQFEATDARRAFPCWDEPSFKATFQNTLVVKNGLIALSNTAIAEEKREGEKRVVSFAETIPMSTYLVAFVVGHFEATEAVFVGPTALRVWSVPGKRHLAALGQEIAAFSLRWFEGYYDCPYPSDKLDLIGIPDFAAGAMENLGAITFRETALFVDPAATTHNELERVGDVVAHENAHMWFGDLVTMAWWNGLWLNEAFATFMEMLAVDAWRPQWKRWTTFGVSRSEAFLVDGLHSTRPIEFPVQAPQDADAMFDVLTYKKGASVLRMLEQFIGPAVFRDGVRLYLKRHAFGNTETKDLWAALGEVSRQPIPAIMDAWVFRPGYPLVQCRCEAGKLLLSQERFTYLAKREGHVEAELWQIPLQVRITAGKIETTRQVLFSTAKMEIELPADFSSVVVNAGGHGFYRVHYGADLRRLLLAQPRREVAGAGLDAIERLNLLNDAWATVLAGILPLGDFLLLTESFREERDKNVWAVLLEIFHTLALLVDEADLPRLATFVRERLEPALLDLGTEAKVGESELLGQLRGDLWRTIGTLGEAASVRAWAAEVYAGSLHPRGGSKGASDGNLLAASVAILAHWGDESRYGEFLQRFRSARTPQEEQRYLYALAAFPSPSMVETTLRHAIDGAIRTQDAPFIVKHLLSSRHGRALTWDFLKEHWDTMKKNYPGAGIRRMFAGVTGLMSVAWQKEVRDFFLLREIDLGGKTVEQYLEQQRILVALREREGAALHHFLEENF